MCPLLLLLALLFQVNSFLPSTTVGQLFVDTSAPPREYIFNLGFPKSGSSSFFEYLQCHRRGSPDPAPSHLISHYLCGRKTLFASREYQTCGECILRAVVSHTSVPSVHKPITLQSSCSGALAYSQMDYANTSHCQFPQIEHLEYLLDQYSDAKFVLLLRPTGHWLRSVKYFFDLKARLLTCLQRQPNLFPLLPRERVSAGAKTAFSAGDEASEPDALLRAWYEWHTQRVLRLFRVRKLKNLLVINIEDNLASVQMKLDHFLGVGGLESRVGSVALSTRHRAPEAATRGPTRGGTAEGGRNTSREEEAGSLNCWSHANKNTQIT